MNVECTRLPSGLTVVTETMPHLESVALGTWIKSGARDETEGEHGIAHLLETVFGVELPRRLQIDFSRRVQVHTDATGGEVTAAQLWALFERTYLTGAAQDAASRGTVLASYRTGVGAGADTEPLTLVEYRSDDGSTAWAASRSDDGRPRQESNPQPSE